MPTTDLDWEVEPMRIFRGMARWDADLLHEVNGPGAAHEVDQQVMELRSGLKDTGVDLRDAAQVYYFVLGTHAQWASTLSHAVITCGNPQGCLPGLIAHSANASVAWRTLLREIINGLPGVPPEPDPLQPTEYGL